MFPVAASCSHGCISGRLSYIALTRAYLLHVKNLLGKLRCLDGLTHIFFCSVILLWRRMGNQHKNCRQSKNRSRSRYLLKIGHFLLLGYCIPGFGTRIVRFVHGVPELRNPILHDVSDGLASTVPDFVGQGASCSDHHEAEAMLTSAFKPSCNTTLFEK
jgi:hypothetical protein